MRTDRGCHEPIPRLPLKSSLGVINWNSDGKNFEIFQQPGLHAIISGRLVNHSVFLPLCIVVLV